MKIINDIAGYIDHTLLKSEATAKDIEQLCREAVECGFASVCVSPGYVEKAAGLLRAEKTKVCTVIGFPLGNGLSEVKMLEAMRAVEKGADELDMVVNVGALKSADENWFLNDIFLTVQGAGDAPVKAIIETGCLSREEKELACRLAVKAGASFVKTCTGFGPGKAEVADIELMKAVVGPDVGVKASGGIKSYDQACKMISSGADRIGSSASVQIVRGAADEQ